MTMDEPEDIHLCPAVERMASLYLAVMDGTDKELSELVLSDMVYLRLVRRMVDIVAAGMPGVKVKVEGNGSNPQGTSTNTRT